MNRDRLTGRLKLLGGQLKEGWGALTGDPLVAASGRRDRIAGKAIEQRGLSREQADRQLVEFLRRNRNWSDLSRR
jgi:uncharacterized protein YjbJ (UPF0337 family)